MTISLPITNLGFPYITGMRLLWVSGTEFNVDRGICRDQKNTNDINIGFPLNVAYTQTGTEPTPPGFIVVNINTSQNGVGGLDSGIIAANTFYYVHAIGDSYGNNPGSALISKNYGQPFFPPGYDIFKRIGLVLTDNSALILQFRQDGEGLNRWMYYDAPIPTNITAGSSATYVPVDASAAYPFPYPTTVRWYCVFTPTAAGNALTLVPAASSSNLGYASASGSVGGVPVIVQLECPADDPSSEAINYKVAGSAVAISVQAYLDQLTF